MFEWYAPSSPRRLWHCLPNNGFIAFLFVGQYFYNAGQRILLHILVGAKLFRICNLCRWQHVLFAHKGWLCEVRCSCTTRPFGVHLFDGRRGDIVALEYWYVPAEFPKEMMATRFENDNVTTMATFQPSGLDFCLKILLSSMEQEKKKNYTTGKGKARTFNRYNRVLVYTNLLSTGLYERNQGGLLFSRY